MAGYTDWLSGEQRGSWCWQCTPAMWVARCVVAGGPREAIAGGGGGALILSMNREHLCFLCVVYILEQLLVLGRHLYMGFLH